MYRNRTAISYLSISKNLIDNWLKTGLLSKDFIRLVFLAMLIASPVAWYGMSKWLQDFAYKIHISWWMFAVAGVLAVLIALMTVSFQAIKVALTNPAKSLRSE